MIERLDHINLRTGNLDAMVAWYREVLDMEPGPRPNFDIPGVWMYANGQPLVHLVAVGTAPPPPSDDLTLEHGAFSAKGFRHFIDRLEKRGEKYRLFPVEDFGLIQVNIWDPDGNHLHVDFALAEAG